MAAALFGRTLRGHRRLAFTLTSTSTTTTTTAACASSLALPPHNSRGYYAAPTRPRRARPSKFVSGVTDAHLESDPALAAWFAANVPTGWETEAEVDLKVPPPTPAPVGPLEARNIRPMKAYLRCPETEEGSRACRRLREEDLHRPLVPGILHGSDPSSGLLSGDPSSKVLLKTPWFQIQRELDRYHYAFECRVYALTVYDNLEGEADERDVWDDDAFLGDVVKENVLVIPAGLQIHPVQHRAFCLNFVRYHPEKPVPLSIKLVNEEESPDMKRGGFLAPVSRNIDCLVEDGAPIPECIELECTGLRAKDVVRMDRLIFPDGVRPHPRVDKKTFLCGTVFGSSKGGVDEADAEGS